MAMRIGIFPIDERKQPLISILKSFGKYTAVFVLTAIILITCFIGVAKIPQERIYENTVESALFLQDRESAFPTTVPGVLPSTADYYADAVLLCIAYYLDPSRPVETIAWARFYTEDRYEYNGFVKRFFPKALQNHLPANQQYLRYWHGSILFVRPLLLLFNIQGMYHFLGIVLFVLTACFLRLLFRTGMKGEAAAFIVSMIAVSIWFVPLNLEYLWMFFCTLPASMLTIRLSLRGRYDCLGSLFLIIGMVTVFLDFFTTETMTLVIPLLFAVNIRNRDGHEGCVHTVSRPHRFCSVNSEKDKNSGAGAGGNAKIQKGKGPGNWKLVFSCSILWGIGYVGMWVLKWIFAAVVLGRDVMPFVRDSITEHLGTEANMSMVQLRLLAVQRCVTKLFPLRYGIIGQISAIAMILVFITIPVLTNRLALKDHARKEIAFLYLSLSIIPIMRFVVIPYHTYVHSWFVYRALSGTILALCFMLLELTEIRQPQKHSSADVN